MEQFWKERLAKHEEAEREKLREQYATALSKYLETLPEKPNQKIDEASGTLYTAEI